MAAASDNITDIFANSDFQDAYSDAVSLIPMADIQIHTIDLVFQDLAGQMFTLSVQAKTRVKDLKHLLLSNLPATHSYCTEHRECISHKNIKLFIDSAGDAKSDDEKSDDEKSDDEKSDDDKSLTYITLDDSCNLGSYNILSGTTVYFFIKKPEWQTMIDNWLAGDGNFPPKELHSIVFQHIFERKDEPDFQCVIGYCYWWGRGTSVQDNLGIVLFEKAAALGVAQAHLQLGYMYYRNYSHLRDEIRYNTSLRFEKVMQYYTKACELGSRQARCQLGLFYLYGDCVEKNISKAVEYFEPLLITNTIPKDEWRIYYQIGMAYKNGTDVKKDLDRAITFFKMGASSGSTGCKKELCLLGIQS